MTQATMEPLTDDAIPEEIAERSACYRQAAAGQREQAARDRAEAEQIRAAAREEAARITAEAEARARPLDDTASAAENGAGRDAETGERLGRAAAAAERARASAARVKVLEDERDELAVKQSGLGRQAADAAGQARALEPQLAAALEGTDLDLITSIRNRLDSIRAREAALRAQQAPVLARLDVIGTGEMLPLWPQKELAEARRVASMDQSQVHRALNWALPDRPEAVAAREREQRSRLADRAAEEYAADRAERERQERPRPPIRL